MTHRSTRYQLSRRGLLRAGAWGMGALGAGSLAACSSDNGALSFWHFNPDNDPAGEWIASTVAAWNKDNKAQVQTRFVPGNDYMDGPTLQTGFSSGEGPDIFLLSPGDFLRYSNAGALVDLTDYLGESVREDYLPGTLDTRSVDDRIFGLPMESEPLGLFYSVQAFEDAGLSEADVPETWDEMLDIAERLTSSRIFGLVMETNPGYYQNFTWYPFLWQGGGSPVSADQKSATFDSEASVAAMDLWQEAMRRGVMPSKPQGGGGNDSISNLGAGYCAMQQSGVWAIGELANQRPDMELGAAPLPLPPGGGETITAAGGWALCANANGKDPESAARFIAWALGSDDADCIERGRQWNTVIKKNMPVRKKVEQLAQREGDFDSDAYRLFVDEIAPVAKGEPRYPVEIYRSISDALQATQLEGADPATAVAEANEQIATFLSGYEGASIL